jgi:hypothetical protein
LRQTDLSLSFKIGAVIYMCPGTISTTKGPQKFSIIRKIYLCACARLNSHTLGKISAEIAVFPGIISTAKGQEHCSIIRELHLCAFARLSSRSLGKLGTEISVPSWNHFYCLGPKALFFIIRKLHHSACAKLSSRSLGNIGAEIAVFSCILEIFLLPGDHSSVPKSENCTSEHAPDLALAVLAR